MLERYNKARRLWKPVSRTTFFLVVVLLLPVALQVSVCKVLKYRHLSPTWNPNEALMALRSDLFFFGVTFVVFLLWLEHTRGWFRRLGVISLHLLVFSWMVLAAVEHGFFTTTGSVGDWYLLRYGLTQVRIMAKLIASKMPWSALLLIYLVVIHLLPYTIGRLSVVRRWLNSKPHRGFSLRLLPRTLLLAMLCAPLLFMGRAFHDGEMRFLNQNVFVRVSQQMIDEARSGAEPAAQPKKHKPFFNIRELRWERTPKTKPYNVVLIILESQRADSTSMYPPYLPTTPFLATLAKRGLVVDHMYPVIPHTSKALVSTLCGIPPKITMPAVEGRINGLPGQCIPKLLKANKYKTAFFSSATNRFEHRHQLLLNMGFQTIRTFEHLSTKGFEKTNNFGYEDDIMIEPSLRWVDRSIAQKKPFFLSYLTLVSHVEYNTPKRFRMKRYTNRSDHEYHKYLNAIRYTDEFIKKLMAGFKKRGLYKNTLFIFQADHGEGFSEHNKRQHDNALFEEVGHSASMLFGPGVLPRTGRIKGLRQQFDIAPTIAEVLGLQAVGGLVPGTSLLQPVDPRRDFFMSCWYRRFCMALREGPIKYIYHYTRRRPEVFDLQKDPFEKKNLAEQGKFTKKKIKQKIEKMLQIRQRINRDYELSARAKLQHNISPLPFKTQTPVNLRFGNMLRLVGFTLHNKSKIIPREGTVDMTFVFYTERKIPRRWNLFFHNQAVAYKAFQNADHPLFQGAYPLWQWKPKHYIRYRFRMQLDKAYRPKARVKLQFGMWAPGIGQAAIFDANNQKRKKKHYTYLTIKIK